MKTHRIWTRRAALRAGFLVFAGSPFLVQLSHIRRYRQGQVFRRSFEFFGTRLHIVIMDTSRELAEVATREAAAEAGVIHRLMTTHQPGSPLSRVNNASGSDPVEVDWRIREVVSRSLDFSRRFEGLFDVTTLPLLEAWGLRNYRFDQAVDEKALRRALEVVGYQQIELTETHLGLRRRGAAIDVGGIAKGFAVDRMIEILKRRGVTRALVEAGGDLFALGTPPDADHWTVGVQTEKGAGVCATLELKDQAVATSGISEAHVLRAGKRVGHLIDPVTGQPAGRYASTSVVASTVLEADALSTTLFVAAGRPLSGWPGKRAGWLHVLGRNEENREFESGGTLPPWKPVDTGLYQKEIHWEILGT